MYTNLSGLENRGFNFLETNIIYPSEVEAEIKNKVYEIVVGSLKKEDFLVVVTDKPKAIYAISCKLKIVNKESLERILEEVTKKTNGDNIKKINFSPSKFRVK